MAPKQTRAAAAKTKELQSVETPLMRRLRNIKMPRYRKLRGKKPRQKSKNGPMWTRK